MHPTRKFRPEFVMALEERKVLSHLVGTTSTATAGLHTPAEVFTKNQAPSVVALVNASFASFVRDYSATRAVYFASIQARTAPIGNEIETDKTNGSGDLVAIQQYTRQRLDLLAQQLRNNFQQSSLYQQKNSHNSHNTTNPMAIITEKIDSVPKTATAKMPYDNGTLGKALFQTIPSPTASPTAVALNALAQDNAIEASRIAIINGINYLKVQSSQKH